KRPPDWAETQAYTGDGVKINSGFLDGLSVTDAKRRAIDWLVAEGRGRGKVNYRLRDWGISRQAYWGAPIPILYCEPCGVGAVRDGARARRESPGRAARGRPDQRQGRLPARRGGQLRQRHVPAVRREGPAGHRHHGHLRGVVVVLPALLLAALPGRHVREGRR